MPGTAEKTHSSKTITKIFQFIKKIFMCYSLTKIINKLNEYQQHEFTSCFKCPIFQMEIVFQREDPYLHFAIGCSEECVLKVTLDNKETVLSNPLLFLLRCQRFIAAWQKHRDLCISYNNISL